MSKITLQVPELAEPKTVEARLEGDQFSVAVDDTVYEGSLVITGPGEGWLNLQGRILPFYMSQKQDLLSIWVDGRTYQMQLITPESRRGGAGSAALSGDVKAPMPGTVLKIPVKEGDKVEANQPLVIMESMKMEMTLSAPAAATVTGIQCQEGQLVEMGAVLVKLEPEA